MELDCLYLDRELKISACGELKSNIEIKLECGNEAD